MMSHYLPPQIVQGEQHPGLREGRGLGVLALPLVLAGPVEQAEPLHCGGDLLVLKRGGPDPKRAPEKWCLADALNSACCTQPPSLLKHLLWCSECATVTQRFIQARSVGLLLPTVRHFLW